MAYKLKPEIESQLIAEYSSNSTITLRELSKKFNIHHVSISACLKRNGVKVRRTGARPGHEVKLSTREKFSKIHSGNKYATGRNQTNSSRLKIIASNLQVTNEFIFNYPDANKLNLLCQWMNCDRNIKNFEKESKMEFIDHFYNDGDFKRIWDKWIESNMNSAYKPSLDHKIPFSRGGTCNFGNLQVITWFENRAKGNMTQSEWEEFRRVNNLKCDLFK